MAINWTKIYKKHKGLWVALAEDEKTVLGVGKTAMEALNKAKKKTSVLPLLTKMPTKLVSYVGIT